MTIKPEKAVEYLNVTIKVAETGLGWDTNDPREQAFYLGMKTCAEMTLLMMKDYTP